MRSPRVPELVTAGECDGWSVESARDPADWLPDGRLSVIRAAGD